MRSTGIFFPPDYDGELNTACYMISVLVGEDAIQGTEAGFLSGK